MYSLDINFLNDRPEYRSDGGSTGPATITAPTSSRVPLVVGVAVGIALPALVGGFWFITQNRVTTLTAEKDQLTQELGTLSGLEKQAQDIQAQANAIDTEVNAIASVFNLIKPWSALLQDISERIPPGVQLDSIQEAGGVGGITLGGTARNYADVNDFLLTLQNSPFLDKPSTQIQSATLVNFSGSSEVRGFGKTPPTFKFPEVVNYRITTKLSNLGANELIRELERKGAVGLVTRIRTLQEKGVFKP